MLYTLTSKNVLEPETGPIPQEHLAAEVKRIYDRPAMVETKCIEVNDEQAINQATLAKSNGVEDQQSAIITLNALFYVNTMISFWIPNIHLQIQHAVGIKMRYSCSYVEPCQTYMHFSNYSVIVFQLYLITCWL